MNRIFFLVLVSALMKLSAPAHAEGFNNSDGFSNDTNGIRYYHGSNGDYGWQTEGGGGNFYHDSKRNCFTNTVTGVNYTHCTDY